MPSLSICHAGSGTSRESDGRCCEVGGWVQGGCRATGRTECQRSLRSNVNAQREEEPARRYSFDELLHWRKGAVLGDLGLEEVEEPWLLALRGDDEDVQRADVLALVIRQPSPCHVLLH